MADQIAEPRLDMNIKIVAFTVSEKSINTTFALSMLIKTFMHAQIISLHKWVVLKWKLICDKVIIQSY